MSSSGYNPQQQQVYGAQNSSVAAVTPGGPTPGGPIQTGSIYGASVPGGVGSTYQSYPGQTYHTSLPGGLPAINPTVTSSGLRRI